MMRRLIVLFFLVGILGTASFSFAVPPYNLNEGDTFTFSITDLVLSNQVNGTEYYDVEVPISAGDMVEVTIDGIETGTVVIDPTSPPAHDM